MKIKKTLLFMILTSNACINSVFAVELVRLTGDTTPDVISEHFTASIDSNTGQNPDLNNGVTGYWMSAGDTGQGDTSNTNIHSSFLFTVTGLDADESIELTQIDFDYLRYSLSGSSPVMEVFIDTGGGYGNAVFRVDDNPATNSNLLPCEIPIDEILQNGDTIRVGFSFSNLHGLRSRTHIIDNFKLIGVDSKLQYDTNYFNLANLTGETSLDTLSPYLTATSTGNLGTNPADGQDTTGYWVDPSNTGTTTSNSAITNTITFTANGLPNGESINIAKINFDYQRVRLRGSNPVMELYADFGAGYSTSLIKVQDIPLSSNETTSHKISLNWTLNNGDSVTIGFSFADTDGSAFRTHLIDEISLFGTSSRFLHKEDITTLAGEGSGLDFNQNGVSDAWEYRYSAFNLVSDDVTKTSDFDGDGISNMDEANAGTDPRDKNSRFRFDVRKSATAGGNLLDFHFPTVAGKKYTVVGSDDLKTDSWTDTEIVVGDGASYAMEVDSQSGIDRYFYRVVTSDVDSDNDGLSSLEESLLSDFSDTDSTSNSAGVELDYDRAASILNSFYSSEISISASGTTLYEDLGNRISLIIKRKSFSGDEFLALDARRSYQIKDTTAVASNSASSSDYRLVDANGNELTDGVVTMEPGKSRAVVYVEAVNDAALESAEQLTFSLSDEVAVNLWISDTVNYTLADYTAIAQAGHFLSQASMGGTPESISALANEIKLVGHLTACENWIDQQLTLPRESTISQDCLDFQTKYLGLNNSAPGANVQNFEHTWWGKMVQTKEQFRHRMAFALSQVFVTSSAYWSGEENFNAWQSYTTYYDELADGVSLTHRDLLETITYNPFMGLYLSSAQNKKADTVLGTFPDENYAREVMQLFSCGVYSQNQRGEFVLDSGNRVENYTIDDIKEMAKVFTGLGLTDANGNLQNFNSPVTRFGYAHLNPMLINQAYHETSEKVLFKDTANELVIPAGQTGDQDISDTLDLLAAHPSTAPHIVRLLIKRLTSSNPSGDYIARVTAAWRGEGGYHGGKVGDFTNVFKAILLDPEARNAMSFATGSNAVVLSGPNGGIASISDNGISYGAPAGNVSTINNIIDGNTAFDNGTSGVANHTSYALALTSTPAAANHVYTFTFDDTYDMKALRISSDYAFIDAGIEDITITINGVSTSATLAQALDFQTVAITGITNTVQITVDSVFGTSSGGYQFVEVEFDAAVVPEPTSEALGKVSAFPTANQADGKSTGGRIKEPIIKKLQFYRFAQAISKNELDSVPKWLPRTKFFTLDTTPRFGQVPMRAPSVFNYYDSDYSPSLGDLAQAKADYGVELTAPEAEILSPFVIRQFEEMYDEVTKETPSTSYNFHYSSYSFVTEYNYLTYLYAKNDRVIDFLEDINLWLCHGQLTPSFKAELEDIANNNGGATPANFGALLSIIFNSSDFSVSY